MRRRIERGQRAGDLPASPERQALRRADTRAGGQRVVGRGERRIEGQVVSGAGVGDLGVGDDAEDGINDAGVGGA